MTVQKTSLPEVLLITPDVFGDDRGWFMESWSTRRYAEHGIPDQFVQDNVSVSARGVLRGLHFQNPSPQGKLISVLQGEIFDVAVDIRRGSPRYAQWIAETLSESNHRQLYIPPGFAHGFVVISEIALVSYKATAFYDPKGDGGIRWDDPDIGIDWPVSAPILSPKDAAAPRLADLPQERLLDYTR